MNVPPVLFPKVNVPEEYVPPVVVAIEVFIVPPVLFPIVRDPVELLYVTPVVVAKAYEDPVKKEERVDRVTL